MRRLLPWLNWLIALALVVIAVAVVQWPGTVGDKDAAATMAGALLGAASLFIGAEIGAWRKRSASKDALDEERSRVRAALAPEFVRVTVNGMELAKRLLRLYEALEEGQDGAPTGTEQFMPLPSPVFDTLRRETLCLPAEEIDALATFYGGLERTRETVRRGVARSQGIANLPLVRELLGDVQHDFQMAAIVAQRVWPARKTEMPNEPEPRLLADRLKEQAAAIAKAVG